MRVECIKIINPITGKEDQYSHWLTIGRSYTVLSVSTDSKKSIEFRFIGDDVSMEPVLGTANQFKTISKKIPSNWVVHIDDYVGLTLSPEKWIRPGFWEDFFDGDPTAVKEFEEEKAIIYREATSEE